MLTRISRLAWLPPLFAFGVFLFEVRRYSSSSLYFVDDPFISMRFAANLVTHGELSFNPGDKVEGYSNFLHVLIHAITFVIQGGVPDTTRGIRGVALVVLAATLLELALLGVLARGARPRTGREAAWYWAWVLTMAAWPAAFWATAGMETPIEGLLLVTTVLGAARLSDQGKTAGGGLALALVGASLVGITLIRFEGVVMAVALAVALSIHLMRAGRARSALALIGTVGTAAIAYHLFRIVYFGALLPNTYVAKATGGSLFGRLQSGLTYCGGWASLLGGGLALGVVAIAAARARAQERAALVKSLDDPELLAAATAVGVKIALVVWGGGDWMPGFRMLLPVTPIALFLVARAVLSLTQDGAALVTTRAAAIVLALAVVTLGRGQGGTFPPRASLPGDVGGMRKLPRDYVAAGQLVERSFGGRAEEVAIGEAGLVAFEARNVRFMDLFGLVDRDMARQPGWMHHRVHVEHVIERSPAAVLFAHLHALPPFGPYQYGRELLGSPAFHAVYRRVEVGADLEVSGWALYLRRDIDPATRHVAWASAPAHGAK